ncbi:hypothetical protein Clacol_005098 [Clathrus columnatus]|uniref:Dystroglycan-type cadherin-like domain-containing protein n=1 Tax=Clathrus columnatus TaxID=1419009 RepID=A0AAV5AG04_9AGAM|nr:hypothetical protein Clacol_005098 [Clathrus columnatus]
MSFITLLTLLLTNQSFALTVPTIHNPFKSQLVSSNPALSSVYFPSPSSLLLQNTSNALPALRVPPNWSFSIGFSGDTFLPGEGESFVDLSLLVQLDNGNPIPNWLIFNSEIMTLSGVAPAAAEYNIIRMIATTGNASVSDSFIFIVSPHDIAIISPFKTHNITTGTPFSLIVDDLDSILVDDLPYNMSSHLSYAGASSPQFSMVVNTSTSSWMSWDSAAFSLQGTGPQSEERLILPVAVSASFPDQHFSLNTHLTLNVFTSYFNSSWLPAQHIVPGSSLNLDITPFVISKARSDLGWMLSFVNYSSSMSWITFDATRLSLSGTVPKNLTDNLRISLMAQHLDRHLMNTITLDLIVDQDNVGTNQVGKARPTHFMSSKIFKRVLGISLVASGQALISGYLLSRRCKSHKPKMDSAVSGVAYKYQASKSNSRGPIQRVFDNFSISSSPRVGGRFSKTKDIFDAIRNRFRGERLALVDRLGRSQQHGFPDSFRDIWQKAQDVKAASTTLHGPRAASSRRSQKREPYVRDGSLQTAKHLFTPSSPCISHSQLQFTQYSQAYSDNHSRPPNPVPGSSSSSNDILPPVPSKTNAESPRMKAGDFLANKRKAALKSSTSNSDSDKVSSSTMNMNKARSLKTSPHRRSSFGSSLPTLKEENQNLDPKVVGGQHRNLPVHPHFGDSSLEEVGHKSDKSNVNPNRTEHSLERTHPVNRPTHSHNYRKKGSVEPDSPNPSTEEYFGSASNESVIIANTGPKVTTRLTGKPANATSLTISVPSVYSEDPTASSSFPISSYSIAARQPFTFTLETTNSRVERPVPKQHNGAELPPWLRFDTSTNEFWGVTPDVKKGNAINVEIDIWDPKTENVIAGADVEVLG